jgi:hypothetical protein
MWSTLNKRSKFKVNFEFIVKTWKYPQKNRKGRLSDERIINYGSITYWKITRAQKLASAPPLKSQKLDQFLRSSDLPVRDWPIVANTFIRKSTLPVFFEGTFKSLRWTRNWPWTLTAYLRSTTWSPTLILKNGILKNA